MAGGNDSHFSGWCLWSLFWSRDRYPHDRGADLYLTRRYRREPHFYSFHCRRHRARRLDVLFLELYGPIVLHMGASRANSEVRRRKSETTSPVPRLPRRLKFLSQTGNQQPDERRNLLAMKTLIVITATSLLTFGATICHAQNLERISAATGVPTATLQAERESTGLGWGGLEKAHLLANATGQSFDDIAALHQSGQGWGKIAHDNGLNLGRLVSNANRSSQATTHAQNLSTNHGKSTTARGRNTTMHGRSTALHGRSGTNIGRGRTTTMRTARSTGHGSSFRSGFGGSHGAMHSMGHVNRGGGGHHGR